MASRRRRRKSIGKVIVDVERRVRRVEKRPGAKRLKRNVVTTEKLGYRAVTTKVIKEDAVTANEAAFGVTVVSDTDPNVIKEGTTIVDPVTGAQKVWSEILGEFVDVTDPAAQAAADSKSATFYNDSQPAGTAFNVGDMWIDTNDNDKLYVWDGDSWELAQDSASASAAATAASAAAAAAAAAASAAAAQAAAANATAAAAVAEAESSSGVAATAAAAAAQAAIDAAAADAAAAAASASATAAAAAAGAAQSDATAALANAATAYTAAQNSLQPSAYAIQNPTTKQLTSIDATGLTVYTGASASSGPRVVLNSTGLAGFKTVAGVDTATFSISASTGAAVFSGAVTGATITGGTLNIAGKAIIDEDGLLTATGATITGEIRGTSGYFGTAAKGWSISTEGLVGVNSGTIVGGVISGTQFTNGSTFSVSPTGFLIASNAEITGTIKATAGYFGTITSGTLNGWTISANSIVGSGTGTIVGGIISGTQFTNGSTFSVSPTGFLIASDAEITGTIKSGAGYFGTLTNGFLINAAGLTGVGTGSITTTGTVGAYGSNTLTISGGKLSANSVIYLESAGVIDLTAVTGLSVNADTEITGTFEASGSTLFNGANNQINRDTDVGGSSTKNIRNVWIRTTLISATSSSGSIGDIWLQYA